MPPDAKQGWQIVSRLIRKLIEDVLVLVEKTVFSHLRILKWVFTHSTHLRIFSLAYKAFFTLVRISGFFLYGIFSRTN